MLTFWTIYDHPLDYPNDYVVRAWDVTRKGENIPRETATRHASLEDARRSLPLGLYKLGRFKEDDPAIAEVWL
jgi:hypothetical protein